MHVSAHTPEASHLLPLLLVPTTPECTDTVCTGSPPLLEHGDEASMTVVTKVNLHM